MGYTFYDAYGIPSYCLDEREWRKMFFGDSIKNNIIIGETKNPFGKKADVRPSDVFSILQDWSVNPRENTETMPPIKEEVQMEQESNNWYHPADCGETCIELTPEDLEVILNNATADSVDGGNISTDFSTNTMPEEELPCQYEDYELLEQACADTAVETLIAGRQKCYQDGDESGASAIDFAISVMLRRNALDIDWLEHQNKALRQ